MALSAISATAQSNLEFNHYLTTGRGRIFETPKSIDEKFGVYRGWETMLLENGLKYMQPPAPGVPVTGLQPGPPRD